MLSLKAPLSQGADPLLGEEGRIHPRAPMWQFLVPGWECGVKALGMTPV